MKAHIKSILKDGIFILIGIGLGILLGHVISYAIFNY